MKALRPGRIKYFVKVTELAVEEAEVKPEQWVHDPPILGASVAHTYPESQFSFGDALAPQQTI